MKCKCQTERTVREEKEWEMAQQEALDVTLSHHQQGKIDFNIANPCLHTGKDFMIQSL